jgi:hypothetical protein
MGMISREDMWRAAEHELALTANKRIWSDVRRGWYVAVRFSECMDLEHLRWHVLVLQSNDGGHHVDSYECAQVEAFKTPEGSWRMMLFSPSGRRIPNKKVSFEWFGWKAASALDAQRLSARELLRRTKYSTRSWAADDWDE